MSTELSIFNIGDHKEELNNDMFISKGDSPFFDPKLEKVGDTMTFILRLVPYIHDIKKSKTKKFSYAVPSGQNTLMFDSPTTFNDYVNKVYHFCPISDIWQRLNAAQDVNVKNLAGRIRRQQTIYAYVLIMNCPAKPEFNGKIMPMKIPVELDKALNALANPSKDEVALGAESLQPFDLMKMHAFKCTITGHKPQPTDPVMRDWKVEKEPLSEIKLPLGPNNAWTPISQLEQARVVEFFKAQQTINLDEAYGYKTANVDAARAASIWLHQQVGFLPGMPAQINQNFEYILGPAQPVHQAQAMTFGAQQQPPVQQPIPDTAAPIIPAPVDTAAPVVQTPVEGTAPVVQAPVEGTAPVVQAPVEGTAPVVQVPTAGVVIPSPDNGVVEQAAQGEAPIAQAGNVGAGIIIPGA